MAPVVVITANPAVDVTYAVESDRPGESNRVNSVEKRPGGKGVNVARVLEALGIQTLSLLPLGGAAGTELAGALAKLGLEASITPVGGETRTTVTITSGASHPTVYLEPGPAIATKEWEHFGEGLRRALPTADLLVISGSLPRGSSPSLVADWVGAARAAGVRVLVDATGEALLAAAAAGADLLKPNAGEVLDATGAPTVEEGARALLEAGARLVVVSDGERGLSAFSADVRSADPASPAASVPAIEGVRGNPTGAGDAATAGLIAAVLRDLPLRDALGWAAALGASAVLRPVAGEIDTTAATEFLGRLGYEVRLGPPPSGPQHPDPTDPGAQP